MHHFEEFSIDPRPTGGFDVTYRNRQTKEEIRLTVPRSGIFGDPARQLTPEKMKEVAKKIGDVLSKELA